MGGGDALVVVLRAQGVPVDGGMARRIARYQNREALLAALVQRAARGQPPASGIAAEPKDPRGPGSTPPGAGCFAHPNSIFHRKPKGIGYLVCVVPINSPIHDHFQDPLDDPVRCLVGYLLYYR